MAAQSVQTVVYEAQSAAERLAEIGLSLDGLTNVVRQGEYARAEVTDHDPRTAEGSDAYRYRVRALRDVYVPQGWSKAVRDGLEMIVAPDGSRAVITRGGNAGVGMRLAHPQPNRSLGGATEKVVNATLALDPNWFNVGPGKRPEFDMYMLLVYRAGDIVRSELSLPCDVDNGQVGTWIERIILPELDLAEPGGGRQAPPASDGGNDIDVPVIRRR